jgi:15-hydroxyprostaglandin dehydrogenase (NAD)
MRASTKIFWVCLRLQSKSLVELILVFLFKGELLRQVAANAGVAETINIAKPLAAGAPPKPPLKTIDVDLYGPIYSAYLAIHYFRTNSPVTGGRFVVTSSAAGLYGVADLPLYCSAKFGCVGLVRSLGLDKGMKREGITFNAICPGWVETGLIPPGMIDFVRKNCPEIITPMATIMKAYNMFLDSDMSGNAVECTGEVAEPRPQPDVAPPSLPQ